MLRFLVRPLVIVGAGVALGLGSLWLALAAGIPDVSPRHGAWQLVTGPGGGDPYASARAIGEQRVGLGRGEGYALVAVADGGGRTLRAACTYQVSGPMPAGDLWTLTVADANGRPPVNPARRIGFTSRDVVRRPDGTVEIGLGPRLRPGNFVPTSGLADLVLTLRVYGPLVAERKLSAADVPAVQWVECGSAAP